MANRIRSVQLGSIAEEMGLEPGDSIIKINGMPLYDILDYRYLVSDDELTVEVRKQNGDMEIIEVETNYEDLGIEFEEALLDAPRSCKNRCIFCFIDQLPKGMRPTMYFKDDDARLSFLQGNYITLTNLSRSDIERMIRMRISPVNVSVHTTNPDLRVQMLNNRHAGKLYSLMQELAQNGIVMNCQIVLCREINDGQELDRSIAELTALYPQVNSISVVPVGLTAHRKGLYPLKAYDAAEAERVARQVSGWQRKLLEQYGSRIVYLADEFYLLAGLPIPSEEEYEGFPQIENGVGLIASLDAEFRTALASAPKFDIPRHVSVATGELAYPFLRGLCGDLTRHAPLLQIDVHPIKNNFFGGGVTVSGLVCGCDILEQLEGKMLGSELLIPSCMLRSGEDVFLDDTTLDGLSERLNIPVTAVPNDGAKLLSCLLGL